jgi:peptidoglycan hydrolase-like protein with peptidoglycan-binding domain
MKLTQLAVALAAAFSLSAMAAGDQKQSPQAQSGQSQTQSEQSAQSQPQGSQQASASSQSPELVKQAQEKLSAAGHDAGQADGVMGPKTQAALKEFQQSKGLQASGELDQKTIAALGVSSSGSSSAGSSSDQSSSAGASSDKSASGGASSSTSAEKSSDKKY